MSEKPSIWERLFSRVERTVTCWNWKGGTGSGYGVVYVEGGSRMAHRISYELLIGPISPGLHLDHLCRNRRCVNPDHLEAVSRKTNILRGVGTPAVNSRKTHCKYGHLLAGKNLVPGRPNDRECLTCKTTRNRARSRTHRSATI